MTNQFLSDTISMAGIVQIADYKQMLVDPKELGSGPGASKINANFEALGAYQKAFTGNTKAFRGMKDMGPDSSGLVGTRGYVATGGSCKDAKSGELVTRYDYFNSADEGGLLGGLPKDMSTLMSSLADMTAAIGGSATPLCSSVPLSVIDQNGRETSASNHIPNARLCQLDKSVFMNPEDKSRICNAQGFSCKIPNDPLVKAYLGGISILLLYLGMQMASKRKSTRA